MNLSRPVIVTALGLGLLSTGCLGTTDPLISEDLAEPRLDALGPNDTGGGTGTNGLKPSYFHARKLQLLAATNSRLLNWNNTQVSSEVFATGLLQSQAGRTTFNYALACALPAGITFDDLNGFPYPSSVPPPNPNGALVVAAGAWLDGALDQNVKQDFFACMLAHLNPSQSSVPILLTGEAVPPQPGDQSKLTFHEALWAAKIEAPDRLEFYVWPMEDLEEACATTALYGKVQTRVCGFGLAPEKCKLHILDRDDPEHGCTITESNHYLCDGQPALQTRLDPSDVSKLYGGCIPVTP